ncbi:MAG TPA: hypothetical protein VI732_02555 [Alphaproteobacteria bacterium]|nr:hypothetical protein [Alphaproteobacteria bacterium]
MATDRALYRREGGATLIELRLSNVHQLFDSFDPAPFPERSLDDEAEAYIIGSAEDISIGEPIKLVFYLPPDQRALTETIGLGDAIHNYFDYRLRGAQRQLRHQRRDGRITLIIGLAFLFACIGLRQIVSSFPPGMLQEIIAEGLLISGWVAMWRPLDIFLYGWWPLRRSCAVFAKLKAVPVEVRPLAEAPTALV